MSYQIRKKGIEKNFNNTCPEALIGHVIVAGGIPRYVNQVFRITPVSDGYFAECECIWKSDVVDTVFITCMTHWFDGKVWLGEIVDEKGRHMTFVNDCFTSLNSAI